MEERSRVLLATVIGAVAGGVWGWLYLTEGGRRAPPLVRGTVEKARTAANEGWRSLNEITGGAQQGRWSA